MNNTLASLNKNLTEFSDVTTCSDLELQKKLLNITLNKLIDSSNIQLIQYLLETSTINFLDLSSSFIILRIFNLAKDLNSEPIMQLLINSKYGYSKSPILFIAIEEDHLDIIKYLIEIKKLSINVQDDNNDTALHIAVEKKRVHIIKYFNQLSTLNPLIANKDHKTALDLAIEKDDQCIIDHLIYGYKSSPILFLTITTHNLRLLKYLIEKKKFSVNSTNNLGNTLLHEAVRKKDRHIIQYLITLPEIKPLEVNHDNKTPIELAIETQNTKIINFLIHCKYSTIKGSLLIFATYYNNVKLVEYLLKNTTIDINYSDNLGNTASHYAVFNGNLKILQLLIKTPNINPIKFNIHKKTIIDLAKELKNDSILKFIVNAEYPTTNNEKLTLLMIAVKEQHLSLIKYLIEEIKVNVNLATKLNNTALTYAAYNNNANIIEYLIEVGKAQYNLSELLPLNISAKNGYDKNCQAILKFYPKIINTTNSHNIFSPLIEAIKAHNINVVMLLLQYHNIEINTTFALHHAIMVKDKEIIQKLLSHPKTNILKKDSQGKNVINLAIEQSLITNPESAALFLEKQEYLKKNTQLVALYNLLLFSLEIITLVSTNILEQKNSIQNSAIYVNYICSIIVMLHLLSLTIYFSLNRKKNEYSLLNDLLASSLDLQNSDSSSNFIQRKYSCTSESEKSFESISLSSSSSNISNDSYPQSRKNSTLSEGSSKISHVLLNQIANALNK